MTVRSLYRSKLDTGLAPRTVLHIHRTLSKALKQAVMDGLIPRNAAAPVKPPQARREEIRPLNRDQVCVLFEAVRGDRLEAMYIVAVTTGLRRGELQGLKWEDLDLEAGMFQDRRTLSEPKGGYIFEAPKSGKGRNIRLTQRATVALREHRKQQLEERMERGTLWQEHGLVFPSSVGTPISGGNLNRAFKGILQRAGLPKSTRFHDLRHTCAMLLLKQSVNPKFVQELLGRADISLSRSMSTATCSQTWGRCRWSYGRRAWIDLGGVKVVSESPGYYTGLFAIPRFAGNLSARLEGFEPPTRGLGNRCSIP